MASTLTDPSLFPVATVSVHPNNWEYKMRFLCDQNVSPLVQRFVISWRADSSWNRRPELEFATTRAECKDWQTFTSLTTLVTTIHVGNALVLLSCLSSCPRLSSVFLSQISSLFMNRMHSLGVTFFEALQTTLMSYPIGGALKRLWLPLPITPAGRHVMYPTNFQQPLLRLKSQRLTELVLQIRGPSRL